MAAADSTGPSGPPRAVALHYLDLALRSGVRGALRDAIEHAINVAEDNGRSDLTDVNYRTLAVGKSLTDPRRPGFRMRANRSGKVWLYRFDHPETHKQVELRLGTYPEVSLSEARERWEEARRARLNGDDPAALPDARSSTLPTVGELCDRYIRDYARRVKRTADEDEALLARELLPTFKDEPLEALTADAITALMFGIKERGAPRQAEKFRACISTMFRVALGQSRKIDYPDGPWLPAAFRSPMERVPQLAERQAFSTDLKVAELRQFLTTVGDVLHPTMAEALLLQLQTAARISEVINLTWDEIDLDEGVWTLPAARSKNGLEHRVMLSRQSLALLEARKPADLEAASPYVFPGIRDPRKPIRKDATLEAMRRNRAALGLPDGAASHSLRHSSITQLATMGCPREVRDRIANHKPPKSDMDARYNRYSLDAEAREWLQRWADRLDALATRNVVPLEARS